MSRMTEASTALPPPTPPPPPAPAARAATPPPGGGVKETIEQILVAFILAFIFRCFIVEAFVIPTGSMAPTLLGANIAFRCNDCGWKWTVNYSSPNPGDDNVPSVANEAIPARCPNCGYKVPRDNPADPNNVATRPPVRFGDRILVQKYIYLLHDPERWDVVVFKSPADDSVSPGGVEPYTQNYIKRLVGKPGETVMILDGDVYVADAKKELAQLVPDDFVVQTKPYKAQESLWRIVYDADHQPRGLPRIYNARRQVADPSVKEGFRIEEFVEHADDKWRDPWASDDKRWSRGAGRSYAFDGSADASPAKLKFDATVAPERRPLTDWLAYDVTHAVRKDPTGKFTDSFTEKGYNPERGDPLNNVSDLKLAATYQRLDGNGGAARFNLTKQGHRFTAELGADKVRLLMTPRDSGAPIELASVAWSPGNRLHAVEFANVDYRVALRIDGREVLASTPDQFKPDVSALLDDFKRGRRQQDPASVWIEADGHKCALAHVALWRDVYYLNRDWGGSQYLWAMPDDFPTGSSYGRPIRLGADEYFVLGDNSMMSADARVWTDPIKLPDERLDVAAGRVPGRFLLGRAFFVYWPAGFAPVSGLPAFAPNFGEMRFIH